MKHFTTFNEFLFIEEANRSLESLLDESVQVNEAAPAFITNPVKFIKLKNNAKKYQEVLIQKALNDVNYKKKMQAARTSKENEVVKAANAAKNQALKDKAAAISDRMDQLATTTVLKQVKTLGISRAKIAAAETSMKAADAEESKQLKVKIANLKNRANNAQSAIRDYEKEHSSNKNVQGQDNNGQLDKNKPNTTETEPEKKVQTTQKTKGETTTKPKSETAADKKEAERKATISKKIEDTMIAIQRADADKIIAQQEKDDLVKKLDKVKGTAEEPAIANEVAAADKAIKDIEKEVERLTQAIKDLRRELKQ